MHRGKRKNITPIGGLGIVIVAGLATALSGSCLFDTKTNLCESFGIRCAPGQVCAADQAVCIDIGGCGDGSVGPDEVCDDGNVLNNDKCSSNCKTERLCGNGILDFGEECDAGVGEKDASGCDSDCTIVRCGDGHTNIAAGEDCDTGVGNPNTNTCNGSTCRSPACGDGVYNFLAGEMCDTSGDTQACNGDGSGVVGSNLSRKCQIPECGDGYTNKNFSPLGPGEALKEQCDDENVSNVDICPSGPGGNCQEARCGDGHHLKAGDAMHPAEQCDNGAANSDTKPDHCRTNCRKPTCGDNVVDLYESGAVDDEQCDNGTANSDTEPDRCRTNCRKPTCGDNVVDLYGSGTADDEQCDDGAANSNTKPDACRTDCRRAYCGDGVKDMGEACDKGNPPGIPPVQCVDPLKICNSMCRC